jgi:hypothetical protein
LTFTLIRALVFRWPSFFARIFVGRYRNAEKFVQCIADMHKNVLKAAQRTTISLIADAFGGFSPSATALAVPLWRFLTFTLKRALVFRWPSFFA